VNLTRFALGNRTLVLCAVVALMGYGLITFATMPRREDPAITIRTAVVTTRWPGATARKVEELVTDPVETAIKKMAGVDEIRSDSRTGMSIIYIDLLETIGGADVDQYWDKLRNKVDEASSTLPDGCGTPYVNSDFGDVYDVVLALYQSPLAGSEGADRDYTYRQLEVFAETVQDELKNLAQVGKVDLVGVQDERIYIEVDPADWGKIDLKSDELRSLLESRNIVASGGEVNRGGARYTVKPTGEFTSVDQIENLPVAAGAGGVPIMLGDLPVEVVRDYVDPMRPHARQTWPGGRADRCVLVAVSMKPGENIVEMGASVQARVDRLQRDILPPDVELVRINDLPRIVRLLVGNFVVNLLEAIGIVLLVALAMMGWRPALIMAAAVPLCMVASILVVSFLGVQLEQFSIASLIIALGMLVDNAIVVSDNALRKIEEADAPGGEKKAAAVTAGAWDLWAPILTSTLTTMAAFLPMLTIVGGSGEYMRSLPIVVAMTLAVSYLVAMMVTPIMCLWLLKPKHAETQPHVGVLGRLVALIPRRGGAPTAAAAPARQGAVYDKLIRWCLAHKLTTMGAAAAAVIGSLSLVPLIGNQFFPGGIRDQFWVHVWLPEGSSIAATSAKAREVEDILLETSPTTVDGEPVERLKFCTSMVGTGGPRFNLTTNPEQQLTNYALVMVNTTDGALSEAWANEVREQTDQIAGARIDVRSFMLGPYIKNPVEFKLSGPDHEVLREKAEQIVQIFRDTPGTYNPFHNWFNDGYVYDVEVDYSSANLAKVTNRAVAHTMDTMISGGYLTTFREGDHLVPVLLRVKQDMREDILAHIGQMYVEGQDQKIPLNAVARLEASWEPACISRVDNIPTVNIGSQCTAGHLPNKVAAAVQPRIEAVIADLPATYKLEIGGELEKTKDSQQKIGTAFALAGVLILLVLIAQYNSIVKPLIVLSTVPMALIGALLGLYSTGWALGFMPSLGVVSLAGVVINNAIMLIDFIEGNIREGQDLDDAVANAGGVRMKPILLTTLTTVGGMLPLALVGGPMWAGMSWAMIFGLSISTGLTLLVVPTTYAFCYEKLKLKVT